VKTYGEDPFPGGALGTQMVNGIQSHAVSTLKHYAYSVPKEVATEMLTDPQHINPRVKHEIHLYPFKKVIQDAQPMGS
jgi:beta-glucosidase